MEGGAYNEVDIVSSCTDCGQTVQEVRVQVVLQHGGSISVNSELGRGTLITVTLPLETTSQTD
jgi:signal transduction histidine kinase